MVDFAREEYSQQRQQHRVTSSLSNERSDNAPTSRSRLKASTCSSSSSSSSSNFNLIYNSTTFFCVLHLITGLEGEQTVCAPTCADQFWKTECGASCTKCPSARMEDGILLLQESRRNWTMDIEITCDYTTEHHVKATGATSYRIEIFAFPMNGGLEDICSTADVNVSYGAWPDEQAMPSCVRNSCTDSSCVCVNRCQQTCSQHHECIHADFLPGSHDCRLFKKGATISDTISSGHVLSTKNSSTCKNKNGEFVTPPTGTVASTSGTFERNDNIDCEPVCGTHQWKVQCGNGCSQCPALDQEDDILAYVTVANYSIPDDPVLCEYQTLENHQGHDRSVHSNRLEVFGFEMQGQLRDICLVSDINVKLGQWPLRIPTHRERCIEICSQFPECGMADLINSNCRLYKCSAQILKDPDGSESGHVLFVKKPNSCKRLSVDVDGGGCITTTAPSIPAPTSIPTQLPTPHPTGAPSTDPCEVHLCVTDCSDPCGWDNDKEMCVTEGLTTQKEKDSLQGCSAAPTQATSNSEADHHHPITTSTVVTSIVIASVIVAIVLIVAFIYIRLQYNQLDKEKETTLEGNFHDHDESYGQPEISHM